MYVCMYIHACMGCGCMFFPQSSAHGARGLIALCTKDLYIYIHTHTHTYICIHTCMYEVRMYAFPPILRACCARFHRFVHQSSVRVYAHGVCVCTYEDMSHPYHMIMLHPCHNHVHKYLTSGQPTGTHILSLHKHSHRFQIIVAQHFIQHAARMHACTHPHTQIVTYASA